jgi:hypothetical protein
MYILFYTYSPRKVLDVSEWESRVVVSLYQVVQGYPKGFEHQAVVVCTRFIFRMDGVDGGHNSGA